MKTPLADIMEKAKGTTGQELARHVLDVIALYPERHNQCHITTSCGSAHCVYGWGLFLHHGNSDHDLDNWEAIDDADQLGWPRETVNAVYDNVNAAQSLANFKRIMELP